MTAPYPDPEQVLSDAPAPAARTVAQPRWRIPLPRLSPAERRMLLGLIDALVLNLGLLAALTLRFDYDFTVHSLADAWGYPLLLTVLWFIWSSFFDCYDLPASSDASQSVWHTVRASLATSLTYLAIPYFSPPFLISRTTAVTFVALATLSVPLWRLIYASVFVQPAFQRRVLIVGAGRSGSELARVLSATPERGNPYAGSGYVPVGFIDDDPVKLGGTVEGLPVFGDRTALRQVVQGQRVDLVVLAITHASEVHPELLQGLLDLRELGYTLIPMSELYEQITGRVPVNHAGGNLHVVLPLQDSPTRRIYGWLKRLADILLSLIGLAAVALIAPLVALTNALTSPGPLFYRQERVGRRGSAFKVCKFRSMVPNAEADSGAVWAADHDPRITPAGRVLRKTRLDELPQCWNVLLGEMSLIGPRPERPEFVADLVKQVPYYQARHAVRPGITGWAQVRYRYGSSVDDARIKLEYDLYYVKHQGLYLELSIVAKTAAVMFGLQGR